VRSQLLCTVRNARKLLPPGHIAARSCHRSILRGLPGLLTSSCTAGWDKVSPQDCSAAGADPAHTHPTPTRLVSVLVFVPLHIAANWHQLGLLGYVALLCPTAMRVPDHVLNCCIPGTLPLFRDLPCSWCRDYASMRSWRLL
jgi:hypothetical protein